MLYEVITQEGVSLIHPQAIVEPGARIADDVEIGPWSYVGADVEIGSGTVVGPHVVIKGPTVIGAHNRIFQFASVGEECVITSYSIHYTKLYEQR